MVFFSYTINIVLILIYIYFFQRLWHAEFAFPILLVSTISILWLKIRFKNKDELLLYVLFFIGCQMPATVITILKGDNFININEKFLPIILLYYAYIFHSSCKSTKYIRYILIISFIILSGIGTFISSNSELNKTPQVNFSIYLGSSIGFIYIINNKILANIIYVYIAGMVIIGLKRSIISFYILSTLIQISLNITRLKLNINAIINISLISIVLYYIINIGILEDSITILNNRILRLEFDELSGRLYIWKISIDILMNYNLFEMLTGKGFGTLNTITNESITSAHNIFLDIIINNGVIGLLGYIVLFIRITIITFNVPIKKVKYGLIVSILFVLFYGAGSSIVEYPNFFIPATLCIGYFLGNSQFNNKKNRI